MDRQLDSVMRRLNQLTDEIAEMKAAIRRMQEVGEADISDRPPVVGTGPITARWKPGLGFVEESPEPQLTWRDYQSPVSKDVLDLLTQALNDHLESQRRSMLLYGRPSFLGDRFFVDSYHADLARMHSGTEYTPFINGGRSLPSDEYQHQHSILASCGDTPADRRESILEELLTRKYDASKVGNMAKVRELEEQIALVKELTAEGRGVRITR